jgi:4-hydroxybenzoate polyprenyltransferase/phosphoserine phosphatase
LTHVLPLVRDVPQDKHPAIKNADPPLVIDMDGTLCLTDTLHEGILALCAERPRKIFDLIPALRQGKATFKHRLADLHVLDGAGLPLREEVVTLAQEARAQGRSVLLVSAADQRQVDAVAQATDLFDEAIGSDGDVNLSGQAKADWLIARFGRGGFDYVGDSAADLDVWPHARRAIVVGTTPAMDRRIAGLDVPTEHLTPLPARSKRVAASIKAMRPHQWLKNLLVLVPALAAHNMAALVPASAAMVSFCLAASAIYIINDMLDLQVDRRHPRKRRRPFAAGTLPVSQGLSLAAGLLTASIIVGLLVQPLFLAVLIGYVALTTIYSFYLKRKVMIDIWMLGALYTTRMLAGGAATGLMLSEWLLAFSMFLFLSLAAVKRQSELADMVNRGVLRADGRDYRISDIPVVLGVVLSAGYCSVLVLALYISGDAVRGLYGNPGILWLACPLLLYWISRAAIISFRGEMDDDPIVFALKDKVSRGIFVIIAALFLAGSLT